MLCGSRTNEYGSRAFIAEIDIFLSSMIYIEHPEVEVYYSVCVPNDMYMDYYACGKSDERGAICSIRRSDLQLMNFYSTDIKWEYHKIITKPNTLWYPPSFFISGRDPECERIGFTMITPSFLGSSYVWDEPSEPEAHCVITNYTLDNRVIIASSYRSSVTLNPIPIPVLTSPIRAYRYGPILSFDKTRFCVQDVGMFEVNDIANPRISVVGYIEHEPVPATQSIAWHAYVLGPSFNSTMRNNYYFGSAYEWYKHYKIKRTNPGNEYTGGDYQGSVEGNFSGCALFGTPLIYADQCDHPETFPVPSLEHRSFSSFNLLPNGISDQSPDNIINNGQPLVYEKCAPFKGGNAPEFSMQPPENETEITNFYDRITVKDAPNGTNYQIYSVTGQLIQTGTTNPDISTAQLSKGMYILRLETGKAFKFVK